MFIYNWYVYYIYLDGNMNGFMEKMNYPYGNLPFARLRYIHSYEDSTYIL